MFLKDIHLKNFRCFENLELSFTKEDNSTRKWTLLLAENGNGKSNLLKAIGLITAGSDALSDLLGEPDDWIKFKEPFCEICATIITTDNKERNLKLNIHRGEGRSDVVINNKKNLEPIDDAINHANRNYFVVGYGVSRKLNLSRGLQSKESRYSTRARNLASLFDDEALLIPLENWAMDIDYVRGEVGRDLVSRVLDDFLPDISFYKIDKEKRTLLFKTADGTIPLHLLSDGYQNMAGWIGDLLSRITHTFKDYKSPLKARGLILIDELALHLHLKWQRHLLKYIDKNLPNFQLITTTHSPMTAQQAGIGELYYLTRENRKIRIHAFSGNPKNLSLNQLITSDVFGLETDESAELEEKKREYRKLRDKAHLTQREEKQLNKISEELKDLPGSRDDYVIVKKEHIKLLEKIQVEIEEKK